MQGTSFQNKFLLAVLLVAIGLVSGPATAAEKGVIGVAGFDPQGNLALPEGYRQWVFVGAPVTPNDMNDGKAAFPEFHHVYIDPGSFKQYQETGKFRDGTGIEGKCEKGELQGSPFSCPRPGDETGTAHWSP